MAKSITVTTENLTAASDKITTIAGDYDKTYTNLYSEVEKMASAWSGDDNSAFTNQINGFKDDFQKLSSLMKDYAAFLRQAAKNYDKIQSDIISQAKSLTN